GKKTMTLSACHTLGASVGLGRGSVSLSEEVRACLLFFNALGFVYFDEDGLRDLVILSPVAFLIDPIAKVSALSLLLSPSLSAGQFFDLKDFGMFWVICDHSIHFVPEHEEVRKKFPEEFLELTNHGVMHRKLLPTLWKNFGNQEELEQLAVKFGQMLPLLHTSGLDTGDARYLVPSVLPQRPLDGARAATKLTAFVLVASANKIKMGWDSFVTVEQVVREGFYPMGVYARVVCAVIAWMQTVDGVAVSALRGKLSATEARLGFGAHAFTLSLAEEQGCIRLEISTANPREVVDKLQQILPRVLSECAPSLEAVIAVPGAEQLPSTLPPPP
ncbi:hypothetical protein T484DRAFT_1847510, partial [Baffinella frigidus]